jgi:hypothetical protein
MIRFAIAGFSLATVFATVTGAPFAARASLDPNAPIVYMRQSCGSMANCFSEQGSSSGSLSDLTAWINGTRAPSPANPLIVDIGSGLFKGDYSCFDPYFANGGGPLPSGNVGHVTFRGAGRTVTTIQSGFIFAFGCAGLEFRDLHPQRSHRRAAQLRHQ